MRCVCTAIYIGPHLLYVNAQGGPHPPPPREERRRGSSARLGCRASTGTPNKLLKLSSPLHTYRCFHLHFFIHISTPILTPSFLLLLPSHSVLLLAATILTPYLTLPPYCCCYPISFILTAATIFTTSYLPAPLSSLHRSIMLIILTTLFSFILTAANILTPPY
jgi:hypothetical protein